MSDDVTTDATNPDMAADDVATQHIHERLLALGTQWRGQHVPTDRLAAHVSALAMRDHSTMPARGYPLQQEEFVLTDMSQATQRRLTPRRYIISAAAAVVVIALLSAAFFVVTRKAPGTRPPIATQILPSTTTALTQTTDLPFTATSAAPTGSQPLSSLHMLDATTGWAQTDQKILRTTDGGAHWQNVTPAGITSPTPTQTLIYTAHDAATAWVGDGKTVYRTTNAGQTWQATSLSVTDRIAYLTFVDATHGWAVADVGNAAGSWSITIWRTTDGGASWTRGATANSSGSTGGLPFAGEKSSPAFISPTTGWIDGVEPVDNLIYFYVTHDGGVTWQQQTLPRPTTQSFQMDVGTPTFFTAQDGVVSVSVSLAPSFSSGGDYTYVTHDGGVSWSIANGKFGTPFFLDTSHWWVVGGQNGNDLFYTGDGGGHWATITSGGTFNAVGQLDFVSASVGFATAGGVGDLPEALLRTTDGGRTWQQISFQVG